MITNNGKKLMTGSEIRREHIEGIRIELSHLNIRERSLKDRLLGRGKNEAFITLRVFFRVNEMDFIVIDSLPALTSEGDDVIINIPPTLLTIT